MSETCSNCWGVRNLFDFGVSETCSNCWGVRNLLTDVVGDAVGLTDTVVEMGFDYFYFEILISY